MKIKLILSVFLFLFAKKGVLAQLPNCSGGPTNIIYTLDNSFTNVLSIFQYDVTQPIGLNNPTTNSIIPIAGGALAVSNNLNTAAPAKTFYTIFGGTYWYHDGTNWVNTGHLQPAIGATNICGAGNFIYNLIGNTGQVYRYNGSGNATLFTTIAGFNGQGPFDLMGDCDGGFYVLRTGAPGFMRKYDTNGNVAANWNVSGVNSAGGGGFSIANNSVYFTNNIGQLFTAPLTPPNGNLVFTPVTGNFPVTTQDFASCAVCNTPTVNADFIISEDTICTNSCINFTDQSTGATSWNWSFSNASVVSSTTQNPSNICYATTGLYNIKLVISDGTSYDSITKQVYVVPPPAASIMGPAEVCSGSSVNLEASPSNIKYQWNTSSTNQRIVIAPTVTTTYSVIVSAGACKDTAYHTIAVNPIPTVQASSSPSSCDQEDGSAVATAQGGLSPYTFSWTGGYSGSTITNLGANNYVVTATDANNCSASTSVIISLRTNPIATVSPYPSAHIDIGEQITLNATGGISYIWQNAQDLSCTNCSTTRVTPRSTTQYCVEAKDQYGCTDTACTTIIVDTNCSDIFIPNAFSPNGDGQNDRVVIMGGCLEKFKMTIFNRWGQKVFETTNINSTWDGNVHGEPQPVSTYVYYLKGTSLNGKPLSLRGDLLLVR